MEFSKFFNKMFDLSHNVFYSHKYPLIALQVLYAFSKSEKYSKVHDSEGNVDFKLFQDELYQLQEQ